MWGAVAAGIGALASVAANAMSNSANASAADDARAAQMRMNELNYQAQKEFAQNGIRWKVADAKAAGLHPLAALGASPLGFSPSFQSLGFTPSSDWSEAARGIGNFAQTMGQNIGRAIEAKATEKERAEVAAYESEARKLDLENKQLQNDNLRQRMIDNALVSMQALRNQAGQPPAMQDVLPTSRSARSLPGQGDAHSTQLTVLKPVEVAASHPQTKFAEAGLHPEVAFYETGDGGKTPLRSDKAAQALEDDFLGTLRWHVRNGLGSAFSDQRYAPPRDQLPGKGRDPDYFWLYDNLRGSWYPSRHSLGSWHHFKRTLGFK